MTTLRKWSTTLITAVVTATVLLAAGILIVGGSGNGNSDSVSERTNTTPSPLPGLSPVPTPKPAPRLGPESVPLLGGAALGPAKPPVAGSSRGGVPCGAKEQLGYHVHARLTLFVDGKPRSVPLGIGIGAPVRIDQTTRGPFAAGGSCFSFLHTHASDGIIHIEAPGKIRFRLGQFFDVWRQRLDRRHLGRERGRVVAYVNGKRFRGDPRAIPLTKHAQIQLAVGQPVKAPQSITFPPGL